MAGSVPTGALSVPPTPWSPVSPTPPGVSPAGVVGGSVVGSGGCVVCAGASVVVAGGGGAALVGAGGGTPAGERVAVGRGTGLVAVALAVGGMIGLPVVSSNGTVGYTVTYTIPPSGARDGLSDGEPDSWTVRPGPLGLGATWSCLSGPRAVWIPYITPPTTATNPSAAASAAVSRRRPCDGGWPTSTSLPASRSACWSSIRTWASSCSMTSATCASDSPRFTRTVRSSGTHRPSAPSRSAKQMVTPRSAACRNSD